MAQTALDFMQFLKQLRLHNGKKGPKERNRLFYPEGNAFLHPYCWSCASSNKQKTQEEGKVKEAFLAKKVPKEVSIFLFRYQD